MVNIDVNIYVSSRCRLQLSLPDARHHRWRVDGGSMEADEG